MGDLDANWIEGGLLSVVVYQVKNACGANQMLAASPFYEGRILVGEWTEGIWQSQSGGDTWEFIGDGHLFQRSGPASVLNAVAYSPSRPDTVYAGFITEGLWRSANGGRTWSKLYPAEEEEVFNVSALTVGAADEGEDLLILAGEPMVVNDTASQVVCSRDGGIHWEAWRISLSLAQSAGRGFPSIVREHRCLVYPAAMEHFIQSLRTKCKSA